MKQWWSQLSARDRKAMVLFGGVLIAFLYWLLVWRPLVASVELAETRLEGLRTDAAWLEAAAREVEVLGRDNGSTAASRGSLSLLALAQQSATGVGLGNNFRRGEPVGDKVRVTMEAAAFDDVVRWMELLETRYAVVVEEATIDRTAAAGLVNLTVLLGE